MTSYPAHREADVVLRRGGTVRVRPVRPDDEPGLLAFFRSLSNESRLLRFFSMAVDLEAVAHAQVQVDYVRDFGLIATVGVEERVVAHAMYGASRRDHAEVALAIADEMQGQGLGTILIGQLAEAAVANGVHVFEAEMMPENYRMLRVFRDTGFPVEVRSRPDELHVSFPTSLTEEAIERFDRREQVAAANAVASVLRPRSVAVIGATRQHGTVGGELFHNLISYEFAGPAYPVTPSDEVVHSVLAQPSVEAILGPVDLAVIAVPAEEVVGVAEQCARKGVRALVVISAGFAEAGPEGQARQAELLRICRATGMRLVGPNCFGVLNTDPAVQLNATFELGAPLAGRVGLALQSRELGLVILEQARAFGLGVSSAVSTGNKADISGNDLLQYWAEDPATDVIVLYLESFGNPRRFARISRHVGRTKPIVVVKSGRPAAGATATTSHTGALLAGSDVTVEALFRQSGIIRTDTIAQLFDVTELLSKQPPPKGRRLGIVTNVGGPAYVCANTARAEGLEIPALAEETRAGLRSLLGPVAALGNPVDMLAEAMAEQYRRAIELVSADPNVDAVAAIYVSPLGAGDVPRAIAGAADGAPERKPVISVIMGDGSAPAQPGVPVFRWPESAAIALARAARYGEWRERPWVHAARPDGIDRDAAAAVVATALGAGGGWLGPDQVADLLACYGLPLVEQRLAATPEEAGAAAEELGGRVVLKAVAPDVLYRTEAHAVQVGLRGAEAVREAAKAMATGLARDGHPTSGFLIQRMVGGGVEMLVGLVHDPLFGPVVACGAGGVMVELLKDVSVRLPPLGQDDAREMIRELRTFPLLTGFRGAPARDVAALEDVVLRVSALAEELPQIAEMDCNPVLVLEQGAAIVNARIRLETPAPDLPLGARRRG